MKFSCRSAVLVITLVCASVTTWCQNMEKRARQPETIASALNQTWKMLEWSFVSAADAMPENKYPFAPTDGEFKGVRTFAQQVKHVACANFAFFNEIQGKTPPPECENGGPDPAKTKPELMKYLRDSFAYADQVMATIDTTSALAPVSGRYGGPSTKWGSPSSLSGTLPIITGKWSSICA